MEKNMKNKRYYKGRYYIHNKIYNENIDANENIFWGSTHPREDNFKFFNSYKEAENFKNKLTKKLDFIICGYDSNLCDSDNLISENEEHILKSLKNGEFTNGDYFAEDMQDTLYFDSYFKDYKAAQHFMYKLDKKDNYIVLPKRSILNV